MAYDNSGAIELQIRDWIKQHVIATTHPCTRIVLRHMTLESRPQGDVKDLLIPSGADVTGEIDVITSQVMETAQQDANSVGGSVQMYALYAYYEKDPNFTPRKFFRVSPESDFDRDVAPSEPPSEKGLASQAMRHLEAVMRTSVASQHYLFSLFERQVQRLQDKDERSSQSQVDMMLLMQDVLDGAHSRRLKEKKEESSQAIRENALEYLKVAAPIILNRIAGKPILPEKNKSFFLLASLLENLRPEQQTFLRESLDPAQLAVLSEILAEYEKDKVTFNGEKSKIPKMTGNSLPPSMDGESPAVPLDIFEKIKEKIEKTDDPPQDPVLRRLEQRGADFSSRMEKKPGEKDPE